jgi:uncharacterized phage protein (TIGR02220 family)
MEFILFLKLMKGRSKVYFDIWFDILSELEAKNQYTIIKTNTKYSFKYVKSVIIYGIEASTSIFKNIQLTYKNGSVYIVEKESEKKNKNVSSAESSKLKKIDMTEVYQEIISYLNEKTSSDYRATTKSYTTLVDARIKSGHTLQDFVTVIDKKVAEWMGTDFEKFLRPETLFGNKFETYLNQKIQLKTSPHQKAYEQVSKATELGWNTDKVI